MKTYLIQYRSSCGYRALIEYVFAESAQDAVDKFRTDHVEIVLNVYLAVLEGGWK